MDLHYIRRGHFGCSGHVRRVQAGQSGSMLVGMIPRAPALLKFSKCSKIGELNSNFPRFAGIGGEVLVHTYCSPCVLNISEFAQILSDIFKTFS